MVGRYNDARAGSISIADAKERSFWDDYMNAYEDMLEHTSTEYAPWYVVPADNKWFTRLVVAGAVIDVLGRLDLAFPGIDAKRRKELSAARDALTADDRKRR